MLVTHQNNFTRKTANIFNSQKRRAKLDHKQLDYTLLDLRDLCRRANTCPYCSKIITEANFTVDHRVPVSLSQSYEFANLAVCCIPCNQIKGNLTNDEFHQFLRWLSGIHPQAQISLLTRLRAGTRIYRGW